MPIAYALAVVHVLGAGSDAGTLGLRVLVLGSLVPVGALLGTATGVAVALWYRRGGRLPTE